MKPKLNKGKILLMWKIKIPLNFKELKFNLGVI